MQNLSDEDALIRTLLNYAQNYEYGGSARKAAIAAAVAAAGSAHGAFVVNNGNNFQPDNPLQKGLQEFAQERRVLQLPSDAIRQYNVAHSSPHSPLGAKPASSATDSEMGAIDDTRFGPIVKQYENAINEELKTLVVPHANQDSSGIFPKIEFKIVERDLSDERLSRFVSDTMHHDRNKLVDPHSTKDEFIGILVVPMTKSASTNFEGQTTTIIPDDGDIVFFNPREEHSIPGDQSGSFDGANHPLLNGTRTVLLGAVRGTDAHNTSQLADKIAQGIGTASNTPYEATFLEGTVDQDALIYQDAERRRTIKEAGQHAAYLAESDGYSPDAVDAAFSNAATAAAKGFSILQQLQAARDAADAIQARIGSEPRKAASFAAAIAELEGRPGETESVRSTSEKSAWQPGREAAVRIIRKIRKLSTHDIDRHTLTWSLSLAYLVWCKYMQSELRNVQNELNDLRVERSKIIEQYRVHEENLTGKIRRTQERIEICNVVDAPESAYPYAQRPDSVSHWRELRRQAHADDVPPLI